MSGRPPRQALREDDIRPDELRAEQAAAQARDLERLLQGRDGFVRVRCPACDADQPRPAWSKQGLEYVACGACETVYMSPRPTAEQLRTFYETSENYAFWSTHVFPASEAARRERIFRPRAERVVELCDRLAPDARELLEVGAGFGTFCEEARRTGRFARVVAVEPAPDLAEACRSRGIEVIEAPIEAAALDGLAFDVIASFEVLEHLFSPAAFVASCASLLRPGGLLVLTCPSVKGFDVSVLGPASDTVDAEHLNLFHPASLSTLVERAGLELVETSTPGRLDLELVRKKALQGAVDLADQPFVRQLALERYDELGAAFQDFLAEHGLSSHLWLVARRPA